MVYYRFQEDIGPIFSIFKIFKTWIYGFEIFQQTVLTCWSLLTENYWTKIEQNNSPELFNFRLKQIFNTNDQKYAAEIS